MTKNLNRVVSLSDGKEVYINDPTAKVREDADIARTQTYTRCIEKGILTEEKMLSFLKENGIWNNDSETKAAELQQEMDSLLSTIELGGIPIDTARSNAIRIVEIRDDLSQLLQQKIEHLSNTAEAKARQKEFDYYVAHCAVYNDNRKNRLYFKNMDEFLNKKGHFDVIKISQKCSEVLYGLPDLDDTPEKRFLKEFNFVDDKFRFVNEEGHLTDRDGRLVDEDGRYIKYIGKGKNKKAVFVDQNGEEIKTVERKPFLDEDGKDIIINKSEPEAEETS